jgi:tetratricopeptide (TPR) repeat protein
MSSDIMNEENNHKNHSMIPDRETLIADIPRHGIECDSCGKSNPAHQCRKCYTVYYCGSECPRKLLPTHDCHDIAKMRSFLAGIDADDNNNTNNTNTVAAKNEGCGICLESKCVNPLVLRGCQHAFCTNCLQEWHKMEKLKVECTCPLCRSPTADAGETQGPLATAKLYGARARRMNDKKSRSSTTSSTTLVEEQQKVDGCVKKALQELETVLSVDASNVQALFTKAEIYIIGSQPQRALEVLTNIRRIDDRNRTKRDIVAKHLDDVQAVMEAGGDNAAAEEERIMAIVEEIAGSQGEHLGKVLDGLVDVILMTAEANQELGGWKVAREIYMNLLGLSGTSLSENIPIWIYSLVLAVVVHLFTFIFFEGSASSLLLRQVTTAVIGASLVYAIVSRLFLSSSSSKTKKKTSSSNESSIMTDVLNIPVSLRTLTVPQERHCYMQLIRCYYELGDHDRAIRAGGYAIAMNRHFPGVYEYVAKARKAKGDLAEAIQLMRRSVLYETPWDEENIAKQWHLLKELLEEEEENI